MAGSNERFRVLDVVPFEEEDESPFVGLTLSPAGWRVRLSKLPRVRGSESPRAARSLLPQRRTRVRILPWPPGNPQVSHCRVTSFG
jgi:hypothetical protein